MRDTDDRITTLNRLATEPDEKVGGRSIFWPRGRALGGSSAVNGMIWVHGTPHEYDKWAQDGCPGWAHADLLPWFKKIENFTGGDPERRGRSGPVTVTEFKPVDDLPDAFLDSLEQAGVTPRVKDYNERGYGGSYLQFNTRNGVRCNTRMAYLDDAIGRHRLHTQSRCQLVDRLAMQRVHLEAAAPDDLRQPAAGQHLHRMHRRIGDLGRLAAGCPMVGQTGLLLHRLVQGAAQCHIGFLERLWIEYTTSLQGDAVKKVFRGWTGPIPDAGRLCIPRDASTSSSRHQCG